MKMNPLILSLTMLCAASALQAQERLVSSSMDLRLLTRNYPHTDSLLRSLVLQSGAKLIQLDDNREDNQVEWSIQATQEQFDSLSLKLPSIALVASNRISTSDMTEEKRRLDRSLAWQSRLAKDTTLTDSAKAILEVETFQLQNAIEDLMLRSQNHQIRVSLSEDNPYQYSYNTDSWFSFINMPGAEYKYLAVEQPKTGKTAEHYHGASLRYMFTQGKSYVHLGALRPVKEVSGDSVISDIFYYDWGTDFYARHLGKGKRKYLNPFSGFSLGGMLLNSTSKVSHIPTVEAHVGVEIFKFQFMIFDVRAGYLFPISNDWNRHLRGSTAATAFNFVF